MKKFYAIIIILVLMGFVVNSFLFHQDQVQTVERDIIAKLVNDGGEYIFNKDSYHVSTFSSYSIYSVTDHARCGILFSNISERLDAGSFTIGSQNSINTRVTCVAEKPDQRERVDSEAGEITILDISGNRITGHFEVEMTGAVTGMNYTFPENLFPMKTLDYLVSCKKIDMVVKNNTRVHI